MVDVDELDAGPAMRLAEPDLVGVDVLPAGPVDHAVHALAEPVGGHRAPIAGAPSAWESPRPPLADRRQSCRLPEVGNPALAA